MRYLFFIFFAFAVIALTAAKPSFKRENNDVSQLREVLRKLVGQSPLTSRLSHQIRSGQKLSPLKREQTEGGTDEEECTIDPDVDFLQKEDNDEFFECAIEEAESIEDEFEEIFQTQTEGDKPLYNHWEKEFLWAVRKSGLLGFRVMEMVEMFMDEIGYYRFTGAVTWSQLSTTVQDRILELGCTYNAIRDECYKRM